MHTIFKTNLWNPSDAEASIVSSYLSLCLKAVFDLISAQQITLICCSEKFSCINKAWSWTMNYNFTSSSYKVHHEKKILLTGRNREQDRAHLGVTILLMVGKYITHAIRRGHDPLPSIRTYTFIWQWHKNQSKRQASCSVSGTKQKDSQEPSPTIYSKSPRRLFYMSNVESELRITSTIPVGGF